MGTRHLIAIKIDGEYKVAQYGQWDGYPEGQGTDVLIRLKKIIENEATKNIFLENLKNVEFYKEGELESLYKDFTNNYQWEQFYKHNPWLSRDAGARIIDYLWKLSINDYDENFKLKNSIDFAGDSLFCEWGYVIDFDLNTFEVYKGFNKEPLTESDRFFNIAYDNLTNGYLQIKLIKTYDLDNLPTVEEFIKEFKDDEEE